MPLLSPALQPGDRVRLVSPASFPTRADVDAAVGVVESWGLIAEIGDHALDQWGYMAGRDVDRVADLNDAFRDPGVRAVIATRGGAGAYRIVDDIDYDAVRADPKPLVGLSDITNLHLALWRHCRLACVHGWLATEQTRGAVRRLLTTAAPTTLHRDPDATSAAVAVPGCASGPLIGGNLSAVTGLVGAGLPDLTGAILFVEDFRTIGLGRVDRQWTQLIRSGSLDGIRAIALGLFTGFDGYVDRGWTLLDVLRDRLEPLGVPILGGLRLGHPDVHTDGDQDAVAIGPDAVLDTASGTLAVGPCVE